MIKKRLGTLYPIVLAGIFVLALACPARSQYSVEVQEVIKANALAGTVKIAGQPAPNATVQEYTAGWKREIAVTHADAHGQFHLPWRNTNRIHYLKVFFNGANPLLVRVKIEPKAKNLDLNLTIAA